MKCHKLYLEGQVVPMQIIHTQKQRNI